MEASVPDIMRSLTSGARAALLQSDDRALRDARVRGPPGPGGGRWRRPVADPAGAVPDPRFPGPVCRAHAADAPRAVVVRSQGPGGRAGTLDLVRGHRPAV